MSLAEYVQALKGKSIAVIGIGVSNTPLIELLLENGCDVTACDRRSFEELGEEGIKLSEMGAKFSLGESYLENLNEDVIFRTPGLMPFNKYLQSAKNRGSLITSEMEAFFSLCPCKTIAITGSDGKTTTSTIISELLKAAGYTVHLGGNIGNPLLCRIPQIKKDDIAVLELSSFQLHSMNCSPDIALITNLTPNHLDKHLDFQDYIDAKMAIFQNQRQDARLVLNFDDEHSEYYKKNAHSKISYFSDKSDIPKGVYCKDGVIYRLQGSESIKIMDASEIKLPGEHNVLNYLAAFEVVSGLVGDDVCRKTAMEFQGVEHRLEQVRVLKGVTYINDSIGSSPTRTIAGLNALKNKPVLIAGGYDKKIPFDNLGDEICLKTKKVFLTGDTANKIASAIKNSKYYAESGINVTIIEDFKEAVLAAANAAEDGDTVLFSPACASFDRFKNFAERGNYFKKIIMEI